MAIKIEELIAAVEYLTREELDALGEVLERRREQMSQARIKMIEDSVAVIRDGKTQPELDAMIAAMNETVEK
jgi:hypothetical protein